VKIEIHMSQIEDLEPRTVGCFSLKQIILMSNVIFKVMPDVFTQDKSLVVREN